MATEIVIFFTPLLNFGKHTTYTSTIGQQASIDQVCSTG